MNISTVSRIVVFFVAVALNGCNAPVKPAENVCVHSSKGVCLIPYEMLFDGRVIGKVVSFKGILRVREGSIGIYRTSEDAEFGLREAAILIPEPNLSQEDLSYFDKRMVLVTGTVSSDKRLYWASLKLVRPIAEVPKRPD